MFDLGWTELLVIGVTALIVVGPKDLPGMFKALGQFTGKMRRMAREFSRAMEDAADASGAKDIAKDLNRLKSMSSPRAAGTQAFRKATGLDDLSDLDDFDALDETGAKTATKPGAAPIPAPAAAETKSEPSPPAPAARTGTDST